MVDLTDTITPKSDQLNADDLTAGEKTIMVTKVKKMSNADQPTWIFFEGDNGKPYKPCLTMRRILLTLWGPNGNEYVGKSMTLFRDENVTFGPGRVGGIRISHLSHIEKKMAVIVTVSRAKRVPYTIEPLASGGGGEMEALGIDAARSGTAALKAFWEDLSIAQKKQMESKLDGWKKIASSVDGGN